MSATMETGGGIDLKQRRETAARLWRKHTGCDLGRWTNPAGYTLHCIALDFGEPVGELEIRADRVRYVPHSGVITRDELAALKAIRAALMGGGE